MNLPRRSARALSSLTAVLVVLVSCGQPSSGPATSCTAAPASSQGGLFINWCGTWNGDPCTAAANTNIRTSGQSDDTTGASPRHDPVTDLMHLRNLRAYQSAHPADHAFDADATRMDPLVRAEFAQSSYYRSWTYFQLRDLDRLRPDSGWDQPARYFAGAVYRSFYNAGAGMVVDKSHSYYRTDFAAETAAALAEAGSRYQEPRFTEAARSISANLLAHAADARTHLFPLVVDRLWQSSLHGYVYRLTPEFAVYHTSNGPDRSAVDEDL
jgi:hypothetical protein